MNQQTNQAIKKPEDFAKDLRRKHGPEHSMKIAKISLTSAQIVNDSPTETPPFFEEVEISTDDRGKERVTVDQGMKMKRLKKTLSFWKLVVRTLEKMDAPKPAVH